MHSRPTLLAATLLMASHMLLLGQATVPSAGGPARPVLHADYGKLPLSFEANQGQADPQVRFTSRGNGYSLFLTDSAAVLTLSNEKAATHSQHHLF